MIRIYSLIALTSLFVAAGCSSDGEKKPDGEVPNKVHIEGDHIVVDEHINFATDSDQILDDSQYLMDQMSNLLTGNTDDIKVVKIVGHTDSTGDDAHNLELSQKRADSVKAALAAHGVTQRLVAEGKGETDPLCTDDTPECHEKNRRVEFLILKEDDPSLLDQAVDAVDDAAEATGDAVKDAAEATGEAVEDAADAVVE